MGILAPNGLILTVLVLYLRTLVFYSKDEKKIQPWPTIFARPHITHFERKNSRPDISILTAYEITPTTTLKHVVHVTTHEEGYICIIILKVNA